MASVWLRSPPESNFRVTEKIVLTPVGGGVYSWSPQLLYGDGLDELMVVRVILMVMVILI